MTYLEAREAAAKVLSNLKEFDTESKKIEYLAAALLTAFGTGQLDATAIIKE